MTEAREETAAPLAAGSAPGEALWETLGEISERLLGRELEEDNVVGVLASVGRVLGVQRVRIFRVQVDANGPWRTTPAAEWCASGIAPGRDVQDPALDGLDGGFRRWAIAFARGEMLAGPAESFPPAERAEIERQGVRSLALVPVLTPRGLWGFLGFDDCRAARRWSPGVLAGLQVFARLLGAAFERAATLQRHRHLQASHRALLDNLNEVVFETDVRGNFTYLNAAWETLTGRPASAALGQFCGRVVGPDDRQACREPLVALLRGRLVDHRCEVRLARADGTTRWAQVSTRRREHPETGEVGLVGTIVDISASKQAEEELRAAKQSAEAANRAKSEFLSTMSHELRTPLNAVIGLSESLLESTAEADPAKTRRFLELIHGAGKQLYREINDILDLARIEAGRLNLSLGAVEVGALCSGARDGVRRAADAKGLRIELNVPTTPLEITADERLLTQALHNLVANAVKFTPSGGAIQLTAAADPAGGAVIAVRDSGIGIPPEHLHLLFKPFTQLDGSLSRRFGGAGLGLVLVDKYVRLHGGRVSVESRPEIGSTFTLWLPARPTPVATPESIPSA